MRISDWSSDVCSSDLGQFRVPRLSGSWRPRPWPFHARPVRERERVLPDPRTDLCQPGQAAREAPGTRGANLVPAIARSEEHTSELQSLMRISYAVFCLKKKKTKNRVKNRSTTYE